MEKDPRWKRQYEKTTLVRVSTETHTRIKNLIRPGESIQDVISRAISLLETGGAITTPVKADVNGAVNVDVNDIVNKVVERVNADINNKHRDVNERLDNLISVIEHQGDETGHALELVLSMQKKLEALEASLMTHRCDESDRPLEPVDVMPCENTETIQPESHVAMMMAPKNKDEKIRITPIIHEKIKSHVGFLESHKMKRKQIAELAHIPLPTFGGMLGNSGIGRNILPDQFEALMNIKPGDDCNKQEPGV